MEICRLLNTKEKAVLSRLFDVSMKYGACYCGVRRSEEIINFKTRSCSWVK